MKIFGFFFISLTVATVAKLNIEEELFIVSTNGMKVPFSRSSVQNQLKFGWTVFFLAILLNILFYNLHPSSVDFDLKRSKNKMDFHILGRKYSTRKLCDGSLLC